MRSAVLLLLLFAVPAAAQDEDDAHRADRLRTQALNSRSPNGYAGAASRAGYARAVSHASASPRDRDAYEDARAEYSRRLADWRRRVSACEAGYYDACGR